MNHKTPKFVVVDRMQEGLRLVFCSVIVIGEYAKVSPVITLARAVDERIDRAVGPGKPADQVDPFGSSLVQRVLGDGGAVGDVDGEFVSGDPLTKLPKELSVPGLVGGVPVKDIADDGNAGSVDTEADVELLEIWAIVLAEAVGNVESVLVGVFVQLVESLHRERRRIGVENVGVEIFSLGGFEQRGPEDRARVSRREFVEGATECVVVEMIRFDPIPKEVLSVGFAEELGQPIHRLPFGQAVHYQSHDPQAGREKTLVLIPLHLVVDTLDESALFTNRFDDRERTRGVCFGRRTHAGDEFGSGE